MRVEGGGGSEEREHTYLSNQERAPPQDDKYPGTAHYLVGGDGAMVHTVCGCATAGAVILHSKLQLLLLH